ncbi:MULTISPECIES: thioredoxin-dependent thiol peroxidase [Myxococcus]|nr:MULTISPECIES: thioredoxin-dependent thiol peroxidase [Myxococcus]UYI13885.1 thioredoxin-dependent thiol peroxidase [Myxococcus xanthus]UYI21251.1 thioredoxin-dependent thiol peroxidase [Myxococcus xanthus]
MPQAGDQAPAFQLADQDGNAVSLAQFAGRSVVLYFYPKDDTPGCTVEACGFRDEHSALEAAGAVVLGVSADSTASHRKFATKFNLPFPLLADVDHTLSEAYGVWGEKSLYGRKFLGITRATFLIGPDGVLKQVWPKVKVNGHVAEVLAVLKGEAPAAGGAVKKSAAKKAPAGKKVAAAKKAPAGKTVSGKSAATRKATAKKAAPAAKAPRAAKKAATAKKAPVAKKPAAAKKASAGKKPAAAKKASAGKKPAPAKKSAVAKKSAAAKKASRK